VDVCDKFRQYVPSYDLMTQGCYWNYVRVYAPQGARLLEATGADEAFDTLEELDLTVFAAPLTLEPGEARRVTLVYALPESAVAGRPYSLYAQKQAGSQAHPLQVTLLGAQGALLAEDGLDVLRSPERIQLTGTLRQDRWLTLQPEG
jgi:folate-binding Fe-S cluster repair protein YgfZ